MVEAVLYLGPKTSFDPIQDILITNDDGFQAVGIDLLVQAARTVFPNARLHVAAPESGISGASRSLTFGQTRDGEKKLVSARRDVTPGRDGIVVDGTPADCVEVALRHFLRRGGVPVCDCVLSGVNHGYNLAQDIPLSGTVGAAAHAWEYFGIPALAFSAPKSIIQTGQAKPWVERVLRDLLVRRPPDRFWNRLGVVNVNLPATAIESRPTDPWVRTIPGEYRAIGGLTNRGLNDAFVFDLLEPMEQMSIDHKQGDHAVVMRGQASVTLHYGADLLTEAYTSTIPIER